MCIEPHKCEAGKVAHELNGPTEVKALHFRGPLSLPPPLYLLSLQRGPQNFKHGGGQIFFALSTHELIPTSHFQNDGATSTSAYSVSNSMFLKLKRGGRKGNRKETEADVH